MIAKFYAWDTIAQNYTLVLTCIMGSAQYNNGIQKMVLKYERGYIIVDHRTIFKWKWTA